MHTSSPAQPVLPKVRDFGNGSSSSHPGQPHNGEPPPPDKLAEALRLMAELVEADRTGIHDWQDSVMTRLEIQERQLIDLSVEMAALRKDIGAVLKRNEEGAAALTPEVRQWLPLLQQLGRGQGALDHNVDQIRVQSEHLARGFEALASDMVDGHARAPLLKELIRLWDELESLQGDAIPFRSQEHVRGLREGILHLLDSQGIRPIHPGAGEAFDPRRHEPVTLKPTDTASLQGKVSRVHNTGLMNDRRVISLARVEVFAAPRAASCPVSTTQPQPQ